jgi:hypothetical protein
MVQAADRPGGRAVAGRAAAIERHHHRPAGGWSHIVYSTLILKFDIYEYLNLIFENQCHHHRPAGGWMMSSLTSCTL